MSKGILFVTTGLCEESSGVAIVVRKMASELAKLGEKVTIITAELDPEKVPQIPDVETVVVKLYRIMRGVNYAPKMDEEICRRQKEISCVCVHGFWAPVLEAACRSAHRLDLPVVLSPHGMFSAYSMTTRGVRKKIGLALGYRRTLQKVTAFHATSEQEEDDIRSLGLNQPVQIVKNGVAMVDDCPSKPLENHRLRKLLFLSRIHPKKGLPMLLSAWAELAPLRPDWELLIAGPDELDHRRELDTLIREQKIKQVSFLGPVFGRQKQDLMAEADLFVLPTLSENFGLVVAEALAVGTPVVTTEEAPWHQLNEQECGWCVPANTSSICQALFSATQMSSVELADMGARGREWMRTEFSWRTRAREFQGLLNFVREIPSNHSASPLLSGC